MAKEKLSPMMEQYLSIKEEYNDAILMFRLGDFYEMFFDDALLASKELELTLTGRNCGLEERAPMCGVPHHSADSYIARLVKNGHKVAVCEQMEDPAEAKGIVKRDIVRIYTPGTLDIAGETESDDSIYIASASFGPEITALTLADISTGEMSAADFTDDIYHNTLINELTVHNVRELIVNEESSGDIKQTLSAQYPGIFIDELPDSYFRKNACTDIIENQFNVTSMISLGLDGREEMISSVGSLLMYLLDTQKQKSSQLKKLEIRKLGSTMQLDRSTVRNLELLETLYDHDVRGSLYGVINKTRTAMGARTLRKWLREPLIDSHEINLRLDAVDELRKNPLHSNNISNALKHVYDFQRLTARIASGRVNARDMIALKTTLGCLPDITDSLESFSSELLTDILADIPDFGELYNLIDRAVIEEPPLSVSEGGIIKSGFSPELDDLRDSIKDAREWIAGLENTEKERTGIKTLKVGYNKVFGYYIDVSKGMIDKVPEDYIRKQTLVNNERYITPELKEKESLVFNAETKINKLEYEEFRHLREAAEPYIESLQKASEAVAVLDVLLSFMKTANENAYVRPVVNDGFVIDIKNGRHPAVEKLLGTGMFVANDVLMNNEDRSMLIITGPNMSGKSTYMRQTAVIVLMAQIGCFVPADSAVIGAVDRIFTRIGASDNLAYGQSTFYIEMSELSNIIRNATDRSLIILDEIGRGTSTFDGLSIAWATVKYLSEPSHRPRTMFATHYHELTELASECDNVHNLSVAVAEDGKDVVFLHNITDGPASKSYGIHVAKIAGIPEDIRRAARVKLKELEESSGIQSAENKQLSFFADSFSGSSTESENHKYDDLIKKIINTDINVMTPLVAMNTLQDIIDEAKALGGEDD